MKEEYTAIFEKYTHENHTQHSDMLHHDQLQMRFRCSISGSILIAIIVGDWLSMTDGSRSIGGTIPLFWGRGCLGTVTF